MKTSETFISIPVAILVGAAMISISILIHGGIIKVGNTTAGTNNAPAAAANNNAPAQPVQKTESQMVDNLKSTAKKLGLDTKKFDACVDSGEKASVIADDVKDGGEAGVTGTPAFFVNGRLIPGAVPFSQFKTVIDEELSGSAPADTERKQVAVGNLPVKGSASAPVTIVEFSDYQCPFCGRFYTQTETQLRKEYIDTGKVKFYYRDFPLTSIHPGAQKGAEAARCAGDQNKYWEFHDLVFQSQDNIF